MGTGVFPESVEGRDRRELARVGPSVAQGAIPSQAQLGDKRSEVSSVAIRAEVREGSDEEGTDGLDHVVERDLGAGTIITSWSMESRPELKWRRIVRLSMVTRMERTNR